MAESDVENRKGGVKHQRGDFILKGQNEGNERFLTVSVMGLLRLPLAGVNSR